MALRADLELVRDLLQATPASETPVRGPCADPRLITTYSPAAMAAQAAEAAGPGSPGLVSGRNPDTAPPEDAPANIDDPEPLREQRGRYGLKGLSPEGKRSVARAGAWMQEERPLLAFWTVTLPPEAMAAIREADSWPLFQDRIRHELHRELVAQGLPPHVVGVAELHPQRTRREGAPCVHLHVVFRGKRNRWNPWALDRWRLDGIIARAAMAAGAGRIDTRAAGNVQPVRKHAGRYLAKYITKGSQVKHLCLGQEAGLPRQWWFWTRALRSEVIDLVFPLPAPFVAWVNEHWPGLEVLGWLCWGPVTGLPPPAPPCYWVRWNGPEGLAACLERWQETTTAAE